ncbi:hypothetical protein [Altererythrobacter litoralis]|uniref:Uncharacterized protein n=1 Tax=Altererythrobacter litoralis TaxID=3113904 RepID=A0ABU7GI92_9SPHN|nr:hypothetical protein [Erythrobacteraceae bacterium 1XM1-14]
MSCFHVLFHGMATKRQIEANRRNAQQSTGPRSAEGKEASSRNALKHGVLSEKAVCYHEDRDAFDALLEQLAHELEPKTALECTLVERLSILLWREKRLAEAEAVRIAHRCGHGSQPWQSNISLTLPLNDQYLIGRYQRVIGAAAC